MNEQEINKRKFSQSLNQLLRRSNLNSIQENQIMSKVISNQTHQRNQKQLNKDMAKINEISDKRPTRENKSKIQFNAKDILNRKFKKMPVTYSLNSVVYKRRHFALNISIHNNRKNQTPINNKNVKNNFQIGTRIFTNRIRNWGEYKHNQQQQFKEVKQNHINLLNSQEKSINKTIHNHQVSMNKLVHKKLTNIHDQKFIYNKLSLTPLLDKKRMELDFKTISYLPNQYHKTLTQQLNWNTFKNKPVSNKFIHGDKISKGANKSTYEKIGQDYLHYLGLSNYKGVKISQLGINVGQKNISNEHLDVLIKPSQFSHLHNPFTIEYDGEYHQQAIISKKSKYKIGNIANNPKLSRALKVNKLSSQQLKLSYPEYSVAHQSAKDTYKDGFCMDKHIHLCRVPMFQLQDKNYVSALMDRHHDTLNHMNIYNSQRPAASLIIESINRNLAFAYAHELKLSKKHHLPIFKDKNVFFNGTIRSNNSWSSHLRWAIKDGLEQNKHMPLTVSQNLYKYDHTNKFKKYYNYVKSNPYHQWNKLDEQLGFNQHIKITEKSAMKESSAMAKHSDARLGKIIGYKSQDILKNREQTRKIKQQTAIYRNKNRKMIEEHPYLKDALLNSHKHQNLSPKQIKKWKQQKISLTEASHDIRNIKYSTLSHARDKYSKRIYSKIYISKKSSYVKHFLKSTLSIKAHKHQHKNHRIRNTNEKMNPKLHKYNHKPTLQNQKIINHQEIHY